MTTVGIIGMGKIGTAIAEQLVKEDYRVIGSRRSAFEMQGVETTTDNKYLVEHSDIVVIATKQQELGAVCTQLNYCVVDKLVVSIVAGIDIESLEQLFRGCHIARVMTNIGFATRDAVSAFCLSSACSSEDRELIKRILFVGGKSWEFEDDRMNSFTAAGGCGIGLMSDVVSAFVDANMKLGFDNRTSQELVLQNLKAITALLEQHGDAKKVADMVTTQGGATRKGRDVLAELGVRDRIATAVIAAERKCFELKAKIALRKSQT